MAAATGMRKSTSINDYPEHLNPFREEDNHNRIRFWTLGRKPGRNNSFSLNNIRDLRNTWSLKSFMKKNKKGQENKNESRTKSPVNGEASPIEFRRANQYVSSQTVAGGGSGAAERYVYGGSVTPLPRSRFQERMRSTPPPASSGPNHFTHMAPGRSSFSHRCGEAYPLPGLARSEAGGSALSVTTVGSTNPFDEDQGPSPTAPIRRKKKRAPLPPSINNPIVTDLPTAAEDIKKKEDDLIDDNSFNVELKIVEEADDVPQSPITKETKQTIENVPNITECEEVLNAKVTVKTENKLNSEKELKTDTLQQEKTELPPEIKGIITKTITNDIMEEDEGNKNETSEKIESHSPDKNGINKQDSLDLDKKGIVFEKVNIRLYRRNSSISSEISDIKNNNSEISPNNKRCKSLSNNMNSTTTAYDIPLHIDEDNVKDVNDNQAGPQKVVCKLLNADRPRKTSTDNSISSTEREFIEIDRATRELEQEISRLNNFKYIDDVPSSRKSNGNSVSQIKSRFENSAMYSPNPIPKPRRSTRSGSSSPISPE